MSKHKKDLKKIDWINYGIPDIAVATDSYGYPVGLLINGMDAVTSPDCVSIETLGDGLYNITVTLYAQGIDIADDDKLKEYIY